MFQKVAAVLAILSTLVCSTSMQLVLEAVIFDSNGGSSCGSQDTKVSLTQQASGLLQDFFSLPECGEGLWYRAIDINMNNTAQDCPPPWIEQSSPQRSCGSPDPGNVSCVGSVNFAIPWTPYRRVCGRAVGFGVISPDGFFRQPGASGIDRSYIDGLSLTYGSPRQHIWTFASGHGPNITTSAFSTMTFRCPCDNNNQAEAPLPPSFIGNNYFCDGEYNGALWDGEGCTSACCTFNSPPYFSVSLPTPTSDDIEVRICTDQPPLDEFVQVQLLQVYVQR